MKWRSELPLWKGPLSLQQGKGVGDKIDVVSGVSISLGFLVRVDIRKV
jgi:hypothetical protein